MATLAVDRPRERQRLLGVPLRLSPLNARRLAFAKPDAIRFADALPKTRSGKIMRRLLKDVAAGREATGDTSTLEDLSVLAKLRADDE